MHYHRNAKTNIKQREAIKKSSLSSRDLAKKYEVSHTTCAKWKRADHLEDNRATRKNINYAVPKSFWKIIKKVRKKALLDLDDLLYALKPYIKTLNRSNCYRILLHYRLNRLSFSEKEKRKKFATYKPGFLHIDVFYLPKIKGKRYYCFLAIDRATRMVFLEAYSNRGKQEAADFLVKCMNYFPYRIHHILTDNGREFTMKNQMSFGRKNAEPTYFEIICELAGIIHRKTKYRHPWTNGMAERMVRTIKDHTVHLKRYPDVSSLISDNKNFQEVHNFRRRLKVLNYKTPYEVTLEWFIKEPDIFLKNPNVLLNENIPKL